jgi:glycosyltransferase involved in cell wall biosynthesis
MIRITYIITVYNKEKYVAEVIKSLQKITGNFRKEFIIIDDGSTDNSIKIIETSAKHLPQTIVIRQENQGPAFAVNKGISLAHGDYVHFVDGDDVIASDATQSLLNACQTLGTEVSYGLRGKYDIASLKQGGYKDSERHFSEGGNLENDNTTTLTPSKREDGDIHLIDSPIKAILEGKIPGIRTIGSSGSLVRRSLLEKVSGADTAVFVQDLSMSLRCAKYSKFAYYLKTVSYSPKEYGTNNLSHNKEFEAYNTLQAIANFIATNPDIASKFKPELYRALMSTVWKLDKYDATNLPRYLLSKIINRDISVDDLQRLYNEHIRKLL